MDPNQVFQGGQRPKTAIEEAWHREQERKKYDIIRVINPVSATVRGVRYDLPPEDHYVQYDVTMFQKVLYGETKDMPRFIADRFVEHMKDKIINFVAKKLHDEFIQDRQKKGLPSYTNKYDENRETYETQNYPKTDDPELIAELYDQLWIGLVNKVENVQMPMNTSKTSGEVNTTPAHVKAMERLENKRVELDTTLPVQNNVRPYIPTTPVNQPYNSGFSKINEKLDPNNE